MPRHYCMCAWGVWGVCIHVVEVEQLEKNRSLGVRSVIEGGETNVDKDQGAMVAISQVVSDDVMMAITENDTAREAWDALRERLGEL